MIYIWGKKRKVPYRRSGIWRQPKWYTEELKSKKQPCPEKKKMKEIKNALTLRALRRNMYHVYWCKILLQFFMISYWKVLEKNMVVSQNITILSNSEQRAFDVFFLCSLTACATWNCERWDLRNSFFSLLPLDISHFTILLPSSSLGIWRLSAHLTPLPLLNWQNFRVRRLNSIPVKVD